MAARTVAIGDIHGCSKALAALLEAVSPAQDDLVVPLGDYVDRGPDSQGVIAQLIALSDRCRVAPLLGNHEIMMLDAIADGDACFWLECGGETTLASYGGDLAAVPPEHVAFLRACRRYVETPRHIFLHANYQYDLPLDQQPDDLLFWTHISYYVPPPHQSGKRAVVGHTPQPDGEVLDLGHVVGIDTYCFGTGWLTGLDVDSGQIWQADKAGNLRER